MDERRDNGRERGGELLPGEDSDDAWTDAKSVPCSDAKVVHRIERIMEHDDAAGECSKGRLKEVDTVVPGTVDCLTKYDSGGDEDEMDVSGESDRARLEGDETDEDEAEVESAGERAASLRCASSTFIDDALSDAK